MICKYGFSFSCDFVTDIFYRIGYPIHIEMAVPKKLPKCDIITEQISKMCYNTTIEKNKKADLLKEETQCQL